MQDDDAALGENILDIPATDAEAMISPDRIADDMGKGKRYPSNESDRSSWHQCFRFLAQVDNAFPTFPSGRVISSAVLMPSPFYAGPLPPSHVAC